MIQKVSQMKQVTFGAKQTPKAAKPSTTTKYSTAKIIGRELLETGKDTVKSPVTLAFLGVLAIGGYVKHEINVYNDNKKAIFTRVSLEDYDRIHTDAVVSRHPIDFTTAVRDSLSGDTSAKPYTQFKIDSIKLSDKAKEAAQKRQDSIIAYKTDSVTAKLRSTIHSADSLNASANPSAARPFELLKTTLAKSLDSLKNTK